MSLPVRYVRIGKKVHATRELPIFRGEVPVRTLCGVEAKDFEDAKKANCGPCKTIVRRGRRWAPSACR